MRPFRFSLQSIRVLREQRERTAQQRFAAALRACEDAAFELQAVNDELAALWTSLCKDLAAGVRATKLARTRDWCAVIEWRQKQCEKALRAAEHALELARNDMTLATRDREALDRYYLKCRREYDREAQREDQKILDELGLRRAAIPGPLRAPQLVPS